MAVFNGTNLLLKVEGNTVAHTTSCTLSLSNDLPEATSKASSGFAEHIVATGEPIFTAEGFLNSLEISAEMENAVTYSGSITLTGSIVKSDNS